MYRHFYLITIFNKKKKIICPNYRLSILKQHFHRKIREKRIFNCCSTDKGRSAGDSEKKEELREEAQALFRRKNGRRIGLIATIGAWVM